MTRPLADQGVAQRPKVFGIGFHKTGTKSLASALRTLGYRVTGPNGTLDPDIATRVHAMARELSAQFDAFQDNPWPIVFREMDALHPGSRFVLTVRAPAAWIRSVVRYFGTRESPMREWIYGAGSPVGNEARYLERYEQHNAAVLAHFRARPDDLLVLDLTRGDGWAPLCRFLGAPIPDVPFPYLNRGDGPAA